MVIEIIMVVEFIGINWKTLKCLLHSYQLNKSETFVFSITTMTNL